MLFTQHLLQLAHEGIKLDDITNNELRRPAQESLMKLFAVSLQFSPFNDVTSVWT